MDNLKPLGKRWPCCNRPSGLHFGHYGPDDEIERMCKHCFVTFVITFEVVTLHSGAQFLKVHFARKLVDA